MREPRLHRSGRGCGRGGLTLVELLVALVLSALLVGSAVAMLASLSRTVERTSVRWDRADATRTVWVTTERELRPGLPGRDWLATSAGELELRAFRGFGRVCGPAAEPGLHPVAWRGDRLPVPDRDSLLVLGADGGWRAAGLVRWNEAAGDEAEAGGATGCGPAAGERAGWMRWSGAGSEPPVLVRLFERGAYSIRDGAFRYAREGGSRQPLTPELFAASSGYLPEPDALSAELRFEPYPGSGDSAMHGRITLRFRHPGGVR